MARGTSKGCRSAAGKTTTWKEKVSWGWKFKEGDAWLTVDFAEGKGKYFANGTLKYDLKRKKYILALTGADRTEQVFEGDLAKGGGLRLDRRDVKTGDVYRITMNTLAEGIRYQLRYERQGGGKGLFSSVYSMIGSKEGESIAGTKKKPECIVSGGAATIAVSFQGQQYLRLLHRLPRRVQRQPGEVREGGEEVVGGLWENVAAHALARRFSLPTEV